MLSECDIAKLEGSDSLLMDHIKNILYVQYLTIISHLRSLSLSFSYTVDCCSTFIHPLSECTASLKAQAALIGQLPQA